MRVVRKPLSVLSQVSVGVTIIDDDMFDPTLEFGMTLSDVRSDNASQVVGQLERVLNAEEVAAHLCATYV